LLGIAVHGERDTFGVAHVTLQPLVLLGLTLLAASFRFLPTLLRGALLAGCVLDFAVGIFLQVHIENLALDPQNPPDAAFRLVPVYDQGVETGVTIETDLSPAARVNLIAKYAVAPRFARNPTEPVEFIGDHAAGFSGVLKGLVIVTAVLLLIRLGREALRPG
jgi:hypothetical protein